MLDQIIILGALGLSFLSLFAIAEWLHKSKKWKAEKSRKLVHSTTGIMTLSFPFLLSSHWSVLLLCGGFLFILLGSQKFGKLNSINGVNRKTSGAQLFPIVVYGCFFLMQQKNDLMYYLLPILILSISDPIAALVGKKYQWGTYTLLGHKKTLIGSFAFFTSAIALTVLLKFALTSNFGNISAIGIFSLALATTLAEAVVKNGYDNLSIPLVAAIVLNHFDHALITA